MSREEKIMFEIYRAIYKKLNVDFDELIANGYIISGISYNPAVDLIKFRNFPKNHRIYNEDDILYNLMGRLTVNPEVRKNKKSIFGKVMSLIPIGKLGNSVKAHLLSNFTGGFHMMLS